jgi:hypothetical protein
LSARRGLAVNALLALGAVIACLLAMEGAARILLERNRAKFAHVVRNVAPGTLGFLPNTVERYRSPEYDFAIATNRFGRRDVEWTQAMFDDPENILFVGDSFVLGYGVDDRWTQPTLLEAAFAKAGRPREVFNFGFTGGFPEYIRLLREALDLGIAARLVLVGVFIGNDFAPGPDLAMQAGPDSDSDAGARAATPQRRPPAPRSRLLQFVKERITSSPAAVGAILRVGDLIGVPLYSSPQSFIFLRRRTPEQTAQFDAALRGLREIETLCADHGRELVVVIFPNKIQVENPDDLRSSVYDTDQPNRMLAEFCAREGIDFVDVTAALRDSVARSRERLYLPVDRHLNERGNAIASEVVFAFLRSRTGPP